MSATPYYRVDHEHSGEVGREVWVLGPPGCGKTTFLSGSVRNTALQRGGHNVLVASFTTAAAAELGTRGLPLPKSQIGTLHAIAYRCLDRPPIADEQIDEWNARHPAYARSASGRTANVDDGAAVEAGAGGATEGDQLASALDSYRARLIPKADWPRDVAAFARAWTAWKRDAGLIDFTDMIEHAANDVQVAPGNPDVLFMDEVQDFTPLEMRLVRQWGQHAERLVLAGDDDQAQPPWTRVLTTDHGYVRMDALDPRVHRLVSYDLRGSELNGLRRGHEFTVAVHRDGRPGLVVSAGDRRTECTPDHRWWTRLDRSTDRWVVYLMRRGSWWRVGWTQLVRSDGVLHLGDRARREGADAAWVLRVCGSKAEASMHESIVAARYGVPTAVWSPQHDQARGHYTAETIQGIFDSLDDVLKERGERALADHGLLVDHPLWQPGSSTSGSSISQVRACNLMPGVHLVPVWGGGSKKDVAWHPVSVSGGEVLEVAYSLAVEPHRTYVADGVITSNCIYAFKGATPEAWLDKAVPDGDKYVLSQSWRIPASVHRAAEHWIRQVSRREEKVYAPRSEEGLVRHIPHAFNQPQGLAGMVEKALDGPDVPDGEGGMRPPTVMILATCGYMLDPLKHELRKRGLPFHNPYRRTRGDWNPLKGGAPGAKTVSSRERLLAYLMLDEREDVGMGDLSRPWTGEDVKRWAHVVKKQGIFQRGAAGLIAALPDSRELTYDEVAGLFVSDVELEQAVTPDLRWLERNLLAASRAGMQFPIEVARKRGARALVAEPRVVLGTIHSVKGGQGDVVFLVPDLSARGHNEWMQRGAPQDSIIRCMYVAMTRARQELVVLTPGTGMFVPPERLIAGARPGAA